MKKKITNKDVYKMVTDKLLALVEKTGKLPWQKPWTHSGVLPSNYVSKKPYRGINLFMTHLDDFASPFYMTKNQIVKAGGSWSGKGTLIVFWKFLQFEKENKDGEMVTNSIPLLRYYYVWNEEQITGIKFKHPEKKELNEYGKIKSVEDMLAKMPEPPKVKHAEQSRAFYTPMLDAITMPLKGQFDSLEEYYSTFAHELTHATGHENRLNRDGINSPSFLRNHSYAYEELIAELGASFVCGLCGIDTSKTINNSAAYLQGWMRKIKDDPTLILKASGEAQKAVDYIQGNYDADRYSKKDAKKDDAKGGKSLDLAA